MGGCRAKNKQIFCPMIADIRNETAFFKKKKSFPDFARLSENSTKMNMSIGHWWNDANTIKPR